MGITVGHWWWPISLTGPFYDHVIVIIVSCLIFQNSSDMTDYIASNLWFYDGWHWKWFLHMCCTGTVYHEVPDNLNTYVAVAVFCRSPNPKFNRISYIFKPTPLLIVKRLPWINVLEVYAIHCIYFLNHLIKLYHCQQEKVKVHFFCTSSGASIIKPLFDLFL